MHISSISMYTGGMRVSHFASMVKREGKSATGIENILNAAFDNIADVQIDFVLLDTVWPVLDFFQVRLSRRPVEKNAI